MPYLYTFSHN